MASSSISIEYETSTAITSSTLMDGTLRLVSANRDFGLGAAMPATSPPTIAPAISTAPTETHQRMAALPSFHEDGDTQNALRKAETRNCRSRSQQSRRDLAEMIEALPQRLGREQGRAPPPPKAVAAN